MIHEPLIASDEQLEGITTSTPILATAVAGARAEAAAALLATFRW
jgi:hypothetical protein